LRFSLVTSERLFFAPEVVEAARTVTDWKPKLAPTTNLLSLSLTNEEGFMVSRIDGLTTVAELAVLAQQPPEQVQALLLRLVGEGALLAQPAPEPEQPAEAEEPVEPEPPPEAPIEESAADNASHLKLYREQLYALPEDVRAQQAATASGRVLSAYCFDPVPAVIRQVLGNPLAGLEQARLVATHHQNAAGLEWLIGRGDLIRDTQVQRMLFRNPQLNDGQLRRITQTRRLLELWKLSVSRESTTQTRSGLLKILRGRFPTASAEERVELIFSTEGRVLGSLSGLSVDGHTTALLCARTYPSVMLVQSLARWSATPPALIVHLLKQPLVMRQPRLKAMLYQHPNAPASPRS
jgi:hypothetical protein